MTKFELRRGEGEARILLAPQEGSFTFPRRDSSQILKVGAQIRHRFSILITIPAMSGN